ncbi:MAG: DUF1365 domain-containing protein [Thioclava marina]|uniref:DUF1365 domain-containing protein n=1 Tax=Thioclava TaxID=285107 RepID=UPI00099769B9|nr:MULTISPECIES: DUF1365 domain-containing protein [Thioclava]MBC7144406.1 DUF1365 domain-containing protein [Thioclava marina]OOY29612.1 cyclopropane-fatty-acyl-phospholipid synthase [Thioclava sp. L04-15]TNE83276.1 MAG: DUF1365 domain-containing protein [Paracoccaceae bacterium]
MIAQFCPGETTHARRGSIGHKFRYHVDYVLLDPEAHGPWPRLFSRKGGNLARVDDRDYGGAPGKGEAAAWVRRKLAELGAPEPARLFLLTQPRIFGSGFNPVNFWLAYDGGNKLRCVIAEVSNTFGDRHSYLCATPQFDPITAETELQAEKIFHVSPFQKIAGEYRFRFHIDAERIRIRIDHRNGEEGVIATLTTARRPLSSKALLMAAIRRPLTPIRTLGLIYWQALQLKLKGARYLPRPTPPSEEISR